MSVRESEMGVVVTHIIHVWLFKTIVSLPSITLLVLPPHSNEQNSTTNGGHPDKGERDTISRGVFGLLPDQEDVRRYDAAL